MSKDDEIDSKPKGQPRGRIRLRKKVRQPSAQVVAQAEILVQPKVVATPKVNTDPPAIAAELEPPEPLPASFMSVGQAAAYAGVSAITIRRWIKAKVFRCHRAGKQWKIDPKELVSFMRRNAHC